MAERKKKEGSPEFRKAYADKLRAGRKPGMAICPLCVHVCKKADMLDNLCAHCAKDLAHYGCD